MHEIALPELLELYEKNLEDEMEREKEKQRSRKKKKGRKPKRAKYDPEKEEKILKEKLEFDAPSYTLEEFIDGDSRNNQKHKARKKHASK